MNLATSSPEVALIMQLMGISIKNLPEEIAKRATTILLKDRKYLESLNPYTLLYNYVENLGTINPVLVNLTLDALAYDYARSVLSDNQMRFH